VISTAESFEVELTNWNAPVALLAAVIDALPPQPVLVASTVDELLNTFSFGSAIVP